jgi:hypothetical protein
MGSCHFTPAAENVLPFPCGTPLVIDDSQGFFHYTIYRFSPGTSRAG